MNKRHLLPIFSALFSIILLTISPDCLPAGPTGRAHLNQPTSNVGTIKGNFQVSRVGSANYSITISTPPGTADIAPLLSISYDSQQGNGLLGMGFSLQGLSSISRCPSNLAQNGNIHSVDYTDTDRFCLNGEQLIVVKGAYGADGAEYRTYIDSKTKIVSYGRQGNGPASFKVWTKGGQVAAYGATPESQIYAQGKSTIATWALNQITDTVGNYLSVKYTKDDANGAFYPARIDYTGNAAGKVTPYNAVIFSYEDRPDKIEAYRAGSVSRMTQRLNTIQTFAGSQLVSDYKLNYGDPSPNTGRSVLRSIQQCAGDGVCLKPTIFNWQWTQNPGWSDASQYSGISTRSSSKYRDLNNDGLVDLLENPHVKGGDAYINNGHGWDLKTSYNFPGYEGDFSDPDWGRIYDLNGDGLPDLVVSYKLDWQANPTKAVFLNTGNGWRQDDSYVLPTIFSFTPTSSPRQNYGVIMLDLNGDGLIDIMQNGPGGASAWLSTGSGWKVASEYTPPISLIGNFNSNSGFAIVDLNNDGLPDIVQNSTSRGQGAWLNTGHGWVFVPNYIPPTPLAGSENIYDYGVRFVDLNGDGLPDIIYNHQTNPGSSFDQDAWINTGTGWLHAPNYAPPVPIELVSKGPAFWLSTSLAANTIDLNGDGLVDITQNVFSTDVSSKKAVINANKRWLENSNYLIPFTAMPSGEVVTQDLNGDGLTDIAPSWSYESPQGSHAYLNNALMPDLLISITDGLDSKLNVVYKPITDKSIFTKDTDGKYPNIDIQNATYVVTQTSSETSSNDPRTANKNNGQHITNYKYVGAKQNQLGFGFLGFRQVIATDLSSGITATTTYSQNVDARTDGEEVASETRLTNGTLISSTQTVWDTRTFGDGQPNTTYYMTYTKQVINKTFDFNSGALLSTTTTDFVVDDYGNSIQIVSTVKGNNGSYITTTNNTYNNEPNLWLIGALAKASVTVNAPNKNSYTRNSVFSYDPQTGLLLQSITEPGDSKYSLTTTYTRDVFGNIIKTVVSGNGIDNRITSATYDPQGRFIIQTVNPLGHVIKQKFDQMFGKLEQITDVNNISTNYKYDGLGRLIETDYPDGTNFVVTYNWMRGPNGAVYSVATHKTDSTTKTEFFDMLDRQVAESTQGLNGENIWHVTQYDDLGRITQESLPYFEGKTPLYVQFQYDALGRKTKEIRPDSKTSLYGYNGFSAAITNSLNQTKTKTFDARSNLLETIDNLGNHTRYNYDSYGNLITVTDSLGHTVSSVTYDKYGHKTDVVDLDKGHWSYSYDVLGQLISQKDAIGNITKFQYDKIGRMISRTDKAGTSTWEYDTALHGLGKLAKVTGVAGMRGEKPGINDILRAKKAGLENYIRTYSYDILERPAQTNIIINGQPYTSSINYDKDSRPLIQTFPDGVQVKNSYNQLGFLTEISDVQTKKIYWHLNSIDASGHITSETHSNGLITNYTYDPLTNFLTDEVSVLSTSLQVQKMLFPSLAGVTANHKHFTNPEKRFSSGQMQNLHYDYDDIGNIKQRSDLVNNRQESFSYDGLNRLTQAQIAGGATEQYQYDDIGNIIFKSNVGTYKYGENGAGPHAVTSVTGDKPSVFQYNANGDQIGGTINGEKRNIVYTSFSKPLTISTPKAMVSFYYNADRQGFERVDQYGGKTVTTFYLGSYELVKIDDGKTITTQQKHYIGPSTIHTKTNDGKTLTVNIYEKLKDNLGSVTDITDESGNVVQHFTYTPFGEQQQTKGDSPLYPRTHEGFTGHEEVEPVNLVHMDGRLYDPMFGRFLSADPYVQSPTDGQDLNRYSYCGNNPLRYVDADGFGFWDFISDIGNFISDVVDTVVDAVCDVFRFIGRLINEKTIGLILQIAVGAIPVIGQFLVPIVAAAMAAASGGNFSDILMTAGISFLSVLTWNVVGDIASPLKAAGNWIDNFGGNAASSLLHGVVGGGLCEIQGGSFKDGFLAGAVGDACSGMIGSLPKIGNNQIAIMERAAAAGVIGGTVAAVSGGNFWDGAKTAAFARLFNDEAHDIQQKIHNAAVELANENISYNKMKCNEAVGRIYNEAGLEYNEQDNSEKFPSGVNAKHFNALTIDEINAGLHTGDVAVWYSDDGAVHHMMLYDGDAGGTDKAGKPNNSWSAFHDGKNFGPARFQDFITGKKGFGFEPDWYRYGP